MTPLFVLLGQIVEEMPARRQKLMYGAMLALFIGILVTVANLPR